MAGSIIEVTDNTKRVEVLYAMRGKIRDLSRNRFGNVVLQKLLEKLPLQSKIFEAPISAKGATPRPWLKPSLSDSSGLLESSL